MKSLAALLPVLAGCLFHPKTIENINDDWTSALDRDLGAAVASAPRDFSSKGWNVELKWAGARGNAYQIERGPTGEPIRELTSVVYGYSLPSDPTKCYLQQYPD